MFRGNIRFIFTLLLFPLMTSCGTHKDEFELRSVTPRMLDLQQIHFDFQNQRVLITEQLGQKFCIYDVYSEKTTCIDTAQPASALVPIKGAKDQFAAGIGPYFGVLKWDGISPESEFRILRSIKSDGCPYQLLKVGLADKRGRLWIGSESQIAGGVLRQTNEGNLYHYTTETCNLKTAIERVTTTNVIAWNLDYTKMYFAGCSWYRINVYDYNIKTGEISNQQPFLDFQVRKIDGVPHGMTPDVNGDFWIGCYDGSQIIKVDENARILKTIKLPVSRVTDVAWGGPDLDILYATTTRMGLTKEEDLEQPLAGTVIAITGLKERGLPANNAVICQHVEYFRLINNRGKPNITFDCCEESVETQEDNVLSCV